ncbi:adenine phosphoribosyltransferase [Stenotrophomonas daejeonensis]|uniref:Adenine phosphoribosyltransferase n=1 Tax=Stenotrophomonas daejeonensis TaxID=659018 RepID=A0A0R0DQU4_9GAMM|nr:adenine phosphoribosyltransferase [Stenotrophomonas daejeonensis]KRG83846.1 adenine phosphoribosyltransferase [Stenotrophomonas daejeonensis]
MTDTYPDWAGAIRDVADFPRPGILFKDITPLLADAPGFRAAIAVMAAPWRAANVQAVLGVEARGFILGAALALELGAGFVPVRKPGKLPGATLVQAYALEYGSDRIEVCAGAVAPGTRVLLVDDVLATGGTLAAALLLAQRLEAEVLGAAVLVELDGLGGRQRLPAGLPLRATLVY